MEVPHNYAMTFAGRGLLIGPVPATAAHAAHEKDSPSLSAETIREVYKAPISADD
jgi:hypothetical protein